MMKVFCKCDRRIPSEFRAHFWCESQLFRWTLSV